MDKGFAEMRKKVAAIQTPEDLEERLHQALASRVVQRRRVPRWQGRVAVLLAFFMLFGYHFNTLAYYGRRFVGYDRIIDGSLRELNELGKGQTVDQAFTFQDGRTVILDGIMLDGNQLLAFCRFTSPEADLENLPIQPNPFMRGSTGRYFLRSGAGVLNDEGTELHYVFHFDPPRPWEKTLVLAFTNQNGGVAETGELRFVLDRQKAMGFILRVGVHDDFTTAEGSIRIHSLQASPTRTRIRGRIQGILGLAADTLRGERYRPEQLNLELLVNGEVWPIQGGSLTTDHHGITFERDYEALPGEVLSLELRLVSFKADYDASLQVPLTSGQLPLSAELPGGHGLIVQAVTMENDQTQVTITTAVDVRLSRVRLIADGESMALERTTDEEMIKLETGGLLYSRTLHFAGTGHDLVLAVQRISADTTYNQIMRIPLQ